MITKPPKNKFLLRVKKSSLFLSKVANDNRPPHKIIWIWFLGIFIFLILIILIIY